MKKRNYSRLYAIAQAKGIDLDQYKEVLVSQFTSGRTSSLREMTATEYEEMCDCLQSGKQIGEDEQAYKERLRRVRSAALNRIQRLGVDTTRFERVNEFCLNPRIAGKPFGMLTVEELQALVPKLESIIRKTTDKPRRSNIVHISCFMNTNQLPS